MNVQELNLPDDPSQRVITDVVAKLKTLLDDNGRPVFNDVLPLTQTSWQDILKANSPAAFVYFGEEMKGYSASIPFDEFDIFPHLEILFLLNIPATIDVPFPDVQRYQKMIEWQVLYNLRVPTPPVTNGIPIQVNPVTGKELWEFRAELGMDYQMVEHRYDIRNKWIDDGREIAEGVYFNSIKMQVWVNNRPDF